MRIEDLSKELPKSLEFGEVHCLIEDIEEYMTEGSPVDWNTIALNMQFFGKRHPSVWQHLYEKYKHLKDLEPTSVVHFDVQADTDIDVEAVTQGMDELLTHEYRVPGVRKWDTTLYNDKGTLVVIIKDLKRPHIGLTTFRIGNMINDVKNYVSEDKVALALKQQPVSRKLAEHLKLCNIKETYIYLQSLLFEDVFKLGGLQ